MKKYYITGIVALMVFSLVSCLKDKDIEDQRYGLRGLEDIKLIELSNSPSEVISLVASDVDTSFTLVTVHLNSDQPAAGDITVTLVADSAVLDSFNTTNHTNYIVPPSTAYTLDNLTVTIPAGSRDGILKINTKPNNLSGADYAFGFSIASISDPGVVKSRNYQSIVTIVGVKNKYDGNYTLKIKTVGWDAYGIADDLPGEWPSNTDGSSIHMITSGGNSVKLFDTYAFGAYIQVAFTTDLVDVTGFGATQPKFIFDVTTDKLISVVNDAAPDARNRAFMLNPLDTDSRYDPVEKKIYAAYIMTQTGRPSQYIYDTLTYVGPR